MTKKAHDGEEIRVRERLINITILLVLIFVCISHGVVYAQDTAEARKYVNYAARYLELDDTYQAIKCLEYAIKQDSRYDPAYSLLGDIYAEIPDEKKAEELYKKAVALNPNKGRYYTSLGKLYYEQFKDYKKATSELKKAFHMDAAQHEALYYLGLIQQQEKNYEEAESYFQKALKLKKKEMKYHVALGALYQATEKWDESEKEYKAAIGGSAKDSSVYKDAVSGLASMNAQRRNKKLMELGLKIIPALILVIVILVIVALIRARKDAEKREEEEYGIIVGENLAGISEDVVGKFSMITRMEYGALFLISVQQDSLELETVQNMEKGAIRPIEITGDPLSKWLEKNGGRSFLFNHEKKEPLFLASFPNILEDIEPLEMRIGVPFVHDGKLIGMLFMGCPKGKDLAKLRHTYEKKQKFINRLAVRASGALNEFMQEKMAATDMDTGAYSKSYFDRKILEEIQIVKGYDGFCSILLLEPDGLDTVRKKYGDVQVKAMLQSLVTGVREKIRYNVDTIARFDDRRVIIIMPGTDSRGTAMAGENIRRVIESIKVSEFIPMMTVSGGVATFPVHGSQVGKLIEIAQSALEAAKSQGGNMIMEARRKEAPSREEARATDTLPSAIKKPQVEASGRKPFEVSTTRTGFVPRTTPLDDQMIEIPKIEREVPAERPPKPPEKPVIPPPEAPHKMPEKLVAVQETGLGMTPTPPLKSPFRKRKQEFEIEAEPQPEPVVEAPAQAHPEFEGYAEKPAVPETPAVKGPPRPGGFKLPFKGKFAAPFGKKFERKAEAEIPQPGEEAPELLQKVPGAVPGEEPLIQLPLEEEAEELEIPVVHEEIPLAMMAEEYVTTSRRIPGLPPKELTRKEIEGRPAVEEEEEAGVSDSPHAITMEGGEEVPLALLAEQKVEKRIIPGLPEQPGKKRKLPVREYEREEEIRTIFGTGKVTPMQKEESIADPVMPMLTTEEEIGKEEAEIIQEKPAEIIASSSAPFSLKDLAASMKQRVMKEKAIEAEMAGEEAAPFEEAVEEAGFEPVIPVIGEVEPSPAGALKEWTEKLASAGVKEERVVEKEEIHFMPVERPVPLPEKRAEMVLEEAPVIEKRVVEEIPGFPVVKKKIVEEAPKPPVAEKKIEREISKPPVIERKPVEEAPKPPVVKEKVVKEPPVPPVIEKKVEVFPRPEVIEKIKEEPKPPIIEKKVEEAPVAPREKPPVEVLRPPVIEKKPVGEIRVGVESFARPVVSEPVEVKEELFIETGKALPVEVEVPPVPVREEILPEKEKKPSVFERLAPWLKKKKKARAEEELEQAVIEEMPVFELPPAMLEQEVRAEQLEMPVVEEKIIEEAPKPPVAEKKIEREISKPPVIERKSVEEAPRPPVVKEKVVKEPPAPPVIEKKVEVFPRPEVIEKIKEESKPPVIEKKVEEAPVAPREKPPVEVLRPPVIEKKPVEEVPSPVIEPVIEEKVEAEPVTETVPAEEEPAVEPLPVEEEEEIRVADLSKDLELQLPTYVDLKKAEGVLEELAADLAAPGAKAIEQEAAEEEAFPEKEEEMAKVPFAEEPIFAADEESLSLPDSLIEPWVGETPIKLPEVVPKSTERPHKIPAGLEQLAKKEEEQISAPRLEPKQEFMSPKDTGLIQKPKFQDTREFAQPASRGILKRKSLQQKGVMTRGGGKKPLLSREGPPQKEPLGAKPAPVVTGKAFHTEKKEEAPPPAVVNARKIEVQKPSAGPMDSLTGFHMRPKFEEFLRLELSQAETRGEPCSLLFFTIDNFDELLEEHGPDNTNSMIGEVSAVVGGFLKEGSDIPSRFDGDVFTVLLPHTSMKIARNLADQVLFTIGNSSFSGIPSRITMSIGITSYPESAGSMEELLKTGRQAMEKAAGEGGNQVQLAGKTRD
ncbi:MAG: diguanylate cyclase [Chloroflexi bacterium]|nr:diguanylate cyclase [Chloroflexota bacterium]